MPEKLNLVFLLLLAFILSACVDKNKQIKISGKTMGTQYHIVVVVPPDESSANQYMLQKEVDARLTAISQQMSTYDTHSEISQFNKYKKTDWFSVSKDFSRVVSKAQDISKLTNGAFDITVAPLIDLWGFGAKNQLEPPSEQQINKALKNTGYKLLEVRLSPPAIRKQNNRIRIDLSAIAKGFAVDKIADLLDQKSFSDYLVEIGGEIRVRGFSQNGKPWKIGIESPEGGKSSNEVLLISNLAIATSGDYRNYFIKDGVRFSHTINPTTGKPIKHKLASVTVLHKTAMMADAYATALMVMGDKKSELFSRDQKLRTNMIIRNKSDYQVWQNIDETKIPQTLQKCRKKKGCVYLE